MAQRGMGRAIALVTVFAVGCGGSDGNFDILTDLTVSGNVSVDPVFVSAANLHLQASLQCRNAGTSAGAPTLDFDGDPRPTEAKHDIGADEYVP